MTTPVIHSTSGRLHALDAVRAFALLLGIVLHASMSFQPGLAEAGWPIADSSKSLTMDLTFYVIHVFRMATFFLIAGFFGHMVFHRRGVREFIKDRLRRIGIPLLVFWPVCVVPIIAALVWGVYKINGGEFPEEATGPEPEFPLTHLWFLYILLWIYGLVLATRWIITKVDHRGALAQKVDVLIRKIFNSRAASFLLAGPIAAALALIPDWILWGGLPTPDQSLRPLAGPLFVYLYVFTLGWLLHRQKELLESIRAHRGINFLVGLVAIAVSLGIAGLGSDFLTIAEGNSKYAYAVSYAIAMTAWTLAFIGAGMQFFRHESPKIRYLADASYWIYIMHLPIVMLLQVALMDVGLHWSVKFTAINVITFGSLLVSYKWFVRDRWLGRLLSGKRKKDQVTETMEAEAAPLRQA